MLIKCSSSSWAEHSCPSMNLIVITLFETCMMPWVDTSRQITTKLFISPNKVKPNVSESPSKPGLIFANNVIFLICCHMAVPGWKSAFRAFMRILLEIQIEGIQSNQWRKRLQLQKIVLIKLLVIWCLIFPIWELSEILNLLRNFSKIQVSGLMGWKFTPLLWFEVLGYTNYGKMANIGTIIQMLWLKSLLNC